MNINFSRKNASILDKGAEMILSKLIPEIKSDLAVIHSNSFYKDVLMNGSLGMGESYIRGEWEHPDIDEWVYQILSNENYRKIAPIYSLIKNIKRRVSNLQDKEGAKQVIDEHYNQSAEFFEMFLGSFMKYTCLDFTDTDNIETAEIQSMRKICEKLGIKKGDKVIDYGGGWGGLARFMANEYGAIPTVVTLSKEQADYIRENHAGKVEVIECDYRDLPESLSGSFDKATAIGIWEHIGHKNYWKFLNTINRNLKSSGKILIHSIYTPESSIISNPYLEKYFFPNGELVSAQTIQEEIDIYFVKDGENTYPSFEEITPHYFPTLHAWKNKLEDAYRENRIKISEEEFRKWIFYFMSCAGSIKANNMKVGQFLYKKEGKSA